LAEDDVDLAAALLHIDPENELAVGRLNDTLAPAERPRPPLELAKAALALARREPNNPQHTRRLIETMPGVIPTFRSTTKRSGFDSDVDRWLWHQDEVFCSDMIGWLERLGPEAREAVAPLSRLLTNGHHYLDRRRLASVLQRIDPDACVWVSIEVLREKKHRGRLEAVEALAKAGPRARDAVPVLREVVAENSQDFVLTEVAAHLVEQLEGKP
jgi:hypothetical protein